MSTNTEKIKIIQCYYCGNKTIMNEVGSHSHYQEFKIHHHEVNEESDYFDEEIEFFPEETDSDEDVYFETTTWKMYFCPICNEITLMKFYQDINMLTHDIEDEQMVYPETDYLSENIPTNIKQAFEAVLKVRNIDQAICLIAIRRTLEAICKQQGAGTGSLFDKISNLSKKGILPPVLGAMSHILREFGNEAAHADVKTYSQDDVKRMIEFVKTIIEYIYVLPSRLSQYAESKISIP